MGTTALYPGSFDPPTLGHLSMVERGLAIFDRLIVAVANNPVKSTLFTVEERISLLSESLSHFPKDRLEIDHYDGLTVHYAKKKGAAAVLRGLRASGDFELEFQMAMMNRHLENDIPSVFLMADHQWFFLSSSTVKEAFSLGGDISALVPAPVLRVLGSKFKAEAGKP